MASQVVPERNCNVTLEQIFDNQFRQQIHQFARQRVKKDIAAGVEHLLPDIEQRIVKCWQELLRGFKKAIDDKKLPYFVAIEGDREGIQIIVDNFVLKSNLAATYNVSSQESNKAADVKWGQLFSDTFFNVTSSTNEVIISFRKS